MQYPPPAPKSRRIRYARKTCFGPIFQGILRTTSAKIVPTGPDWLHEIDMMAIASELNATATAFG